MLSPLPYGVGLIGWYYIGIHLVLVWAVFRSAKRLNRTPKLPPRARYFASTIMIQMLLLALALLVAQRVGITLFPARIPGPLEWGVGIATAVLLAFAMSRLWRRAVAKRSRRLHFFMPSGAREKTLWSGVALAAGIGEECAYRGVLFVLLYSLTGSAWAGALLSAAIFAGAHATQSWLSMLIIFFFALAFQGLALWSGALYVPMIAHVLYDLAAGFTYSRLGREAGFRPEDVPAAAVGQTAAEAPGAAEQGTQPSRG